jgi:hypothetical protein
MTSGRVQRSDEGVRPARDHLRAALPPPVAVAEQTLRAGHRVRPQPVTHICRQPDPPISPGRQWQARQRPPQPPDIGPASIDRVIGRPVPAAVLRLQRQRRQHPHRARPAQHGVGQLEQRIRAPGQAPVQLPAENRQPAQRPGGTASGPIRTPVLDLSPLPCHPERHGHRLRLQVLWKEPKDHRAVAVPCQRPRSQRLNGKLSECLINDPMPRGRGVVLFLPANAAPMRVPPAGGRSGRRRGIRGLY